MASIDEFVANIGSGGFTHTNRYELTLQPPLGLFFGSSRFLKFRVASVTMPGKTISTTETKIYGPVRMAPYTTTYDQLTFNLYLNEKLSERDWFENWFHQVIDYNTHKVSYYTDYIAKEANLITYNQSNEKTHKAIFTDLFPITIGPVEYAYGNEEVAQCQITMTYRKYRSEWSENEEQDTREFKDFLKSLSYY